MMYFPGTSSANFFACTIYMAFFAGAFSVHIFAVALRVRFRRAFSVLFFAGAFWQHSFVVACFEPFFRSGFLCALSL